ncbi:MAG TPA: hypothetical protein VFX66_03435 [Sulfuricurvum sp.]|nr:hypothetical protein [Sulfuricurvum sp.]
MIVAIPMDAMKRVYHQNPCTATMFALYELTGDRKDIRYRLMDTKLNPWEKSEGKMVRDENMKACKCPSDLVQDAHHISEHYMLLQVIGKTDYLLADNYCLNTLYSVKNVGIKIYKIPPFAKDVETAINHFIIGVEIADNLQYIHPCS